MKNYKSWHHWMRISARNNLPALSSSCPHWKSTPQFAPSLYLTCEAPPLIHVTCLDFEDMWVFVTLELGN